MMIKTNTASQLLLQNAFLLLFHLTQNNKQHTSFLTRNINVNPHGTAIQNNNEQEHMCKSKYSHGLCNPPVDICLFGHNL